MIKILYKNLFGSQLRTNMASGVVCTLLSTIAMIVGYPLFLHYLGFELYGVWLVLASVLTFARLGDLGTQNAVTKMVAEEFGKGDFGAIQRYLASGLALLFSTGGLILLILLVFRGPIIAAFNLSDELAAIALWLLPYIGILTVYILVTQVLQGTLAGLGRMDLANYIRSAEPALKVSIAVLLLAIGYGVESLLIGSIVSHIFVHLCCYFFIRRVAHVRIFRPGDIKISYAVHIVKFGGTIMGGSVIGMVAKPLINVFLSRYAGVASLPVFEIAYQGTMKVRGIFASALNALMPEFSKLSSMAEDGLLRIRQLYVRSIKLIAIGVLPLFFFLLFASPFLLRLWLQDSFVETMPGAFQVMLVAGLLKLFGSPAEHIIIGLGHVRSEFLARCIEWPFALVLIVPIAVTTGQLSPLIVSLCIVPATALATVFRTLNARKAMVKGQSELSDISLIQTADGVK